MPRYYAKSTVNHNGEIFAPGAKIDLNENEAKDLLKVGAIEQKEELDYATMSPSVNLANYH
jgi:hypothetical protein